MPSFNENNHLSKGQDSGKSNNLNSKKPPMIKHQHKSTHRINSPGFISAKRGSGPKLNQILSNGSIRDRIGDLTGERKNSNASAGGSNNSRGNKLRPKQG